MLTPRPPRAQGAVPGTCGGPAPPPVPAYPHTACSLCAPCCFAKEETGTIPAPARPEPAGEGRVDVETFPFSPQKEDPSCPQDGLKGTCSRFTWRVGMAFQVKFRDEDHCFGGGRCTLDLRTPGPESEHRTTQQARRILCLQPLWTRDDCWPGTEVAGGPGWGTRNWAYIQVCPWTWMPGYQEDVSRLTCPIPQAPDP